MHPNPTNKEGMTFQEWFQASHLMKIPGGERIALNAWVTGEDPSEWRHWVETNFKYDGDN